MELQKFQEMQLTELNQHYQTMLKEVVDYFPVIEKATGNFNKTQSQFMNNMLTVNHPTELRNARQILSEVERTKQALAEAYIKSKKAKIDLKRKQDALVSAEGYDKELLEVEIEELLIHEKMNKGYIEGAIRKVAAYMDQYRNILNKLGKEEFTEQDFEEDEERYHIMKMFEQGLCAARSHNGTVDEGNQIYAHQIGLNGTAVQCEVSAYLMKEKALLEKGLMPPHSLTMEWLHEMAKKYAGSAIEYAARKGMVLLDKKSLHQKVIE